ncbi:FMN-binding protein, partial [Thermodesulfobacteriota bacterium]
YFELGSKSTATKLLSKTESTDNKDLIKLWAKVGEVDKALELIDSYSGSGNNNNGMWFGRSARDPKSERYLLAAEICRGAGRHEEAIAYYEKVLALPDSYTRPMDHHEIDDKIKANANLEGTKLLKNLDIQQVPDGTYSATTTAYGGPLTVQVVIKKGIISSVKITEHRETPSYIVMTEPTARQIIAKQNFEDVDVVTGATITADAIINGAVKALFNAMK